MPKTLKELREELSAQGIDLGARVKEAGCTTQYLRGHGQWLKITRDAKARNWMLARGLNNSLKAHDSPRYGFDAYHCTWDDAIEMAARHIRAYK